LSVFKVLTEYRICVKIGYKTTKGTYSCSEWH